MVSFIPHCMNEIFSTKNNGFFEHPALFAMLFRSVRVENWEEKVYIKEEKALSKIVVKFVSWLYNRLSR